MSLHEIARSKVPLISDKDWVHDYYTKVYEKVLSGLKHQDFTLLEIGIYYGYSLGVWREYFKNATIIGVELNPYNSFPYRPNIGTEWGPLTGVQQWWSTLSIDTEAFYNNFKDCTIIYGDATEEKTFKLLKEQSVDVIIDDGSHVIGDIVKSFNVLYSRLSQGGLYIIEDSPEAVQFFTDQTGQENPNIEVVDIYDGRETTKNPYSCAITLRKNN